MYVFINGTNRTSDVVRNSVIIKDELQERINKAKFKLNSGTVPDETQDVLIYDGYPILSSGVNLVTLDKSYDESIKNNLFRIGGTVVVAIGESDEETAVILTITNNSGNVKLTMTSNFSAQPAADELCGVKIFAGNVYGIKDHNIRLLENIEHTVDCLDYTRIFDKQLLNDTYEDRDARYIINDFCNVTINKNQVIDQFDYANVAEVRAKWTEGSDGDNPTFSDTDYREGTASAAFPWTNAGGTATFEYGFASAIDISEFTGASSGTPTKGVIGNWIKTSSGAVITSITVKIGSDNANYASITIDEDSDWKFDDANLKNASITGTPNWTATNYLIISIVQTGDGSIQWDGIRILEEEFFRHYPYVEESVDFDDFRIPRVKPTEIMQRMAEELAWYWYIDYDRKIHFFNEEINEAPISIDENSDNFIDLRISTDVSRLVNRQVVKGGDEVSTDKYSQVEEGDSIKREWLTKNKFKNLEVLLDDGSVTDLCEAGTTTTNVTAVGHGLATGDYMVNRTRSNAVRAITYVDVDNFTVDAVAAQTTGDSFSTFVAQDIGIEGINEDTSYDYMSNFNEKSIRSSSGTDTIDAGDFLHFRYNEVFPILVQRKENSSITNMTAVLGYSNGIFDGQVIVDRTLKTRAETINVAEAQLKKYANPVIVATFRTTQEGLRTGQLINIKDTLSSTRNIDQTFIIQKVNQTQVEEGENSFFITCSSLLFGVMELLQQLLKGNRSIEVDEDARIDNIEDVYETLNISDVVTGIVDDNKQEEELTITDSVSSSLFTPPFKYEPDGTSVSRYNLASYS